MSGPEYSDEEGETSIRHRIDDAGNVAQGFVAEHSQVQSHTGTLLSRSKAHTARASLFQSTDQQLFDLCKT